jgi:hypothetical protein
VSDPGPCGCDESRALKARVAELEVVIDEAVSTPYAKGAAAERAAIVAFLLATSERLRPFSHAPEASEKRTAVFTLDTMAQEIRRGAHEPHAELCRTKEGRGSCDCRDEGAP